MQQGPGVTAVPAGAPDLLVIVVQGVGNRGVHNKTHIGFVDTHAERRCRGHHVERVRMKFFVNTLSLNGAEPCVVGRGAKAPLSQLAGKVLGLTARRAIQQSGSRHPGNRGEHGGAFVELAYVVVHLESDVGPVEVAHHHHRIQQA